MDYQIFEPPPSLKDHVTHFWVLEVQCDGREVARELTHQNTFIGNLARTSLTERLMNCSSVQQKVLCMAAFLEEQTRRHGSGNNNLEYALAQLQQGIKLHQVLSDLNLSERSLERLFLAHVGITPVLYSRITRFQSAIALMRQGRSRSLTDIAHSLGYFDQSHFIRDFRLFSGVTPGAYLSKNSTQLFSTTS